MKRQREQNRLNKHRDKQERLAQRRASGTAGKGPQIAWDEAVRETDSGDPNAPAEGAEAQGESDAPESDAPESDTPESAQPDYAVTPSSKTSGS